MPNAFDGYSLIFKQIFIKHLIFSSHYIRIQIAPYLGAYTLQFFRRNTLANNHPFTVSK